MAKLPIKDGQLTGPFYMIQSGHLDPGKKDKFGRPILNWPGRSVMETPEAALEGAQVLAKENPGTKFFVMKAVEMCEFVEDK